MKSINIVGATALFALLAACGYHVVDFPCDGDPLPVDAGSLYSDCSLPPPIISDCGIVELDANDAADSGLELDAGKVLDSGLDSAIDSSMDATVDTSIDVGIDAEVDSGLDSGVDAAIDAELDSSVPSCTASAAATVDLRTAGDFAILTKSGISTVPNSIITGNIGVSPIAASAITGFSLILDSSNTFSTSTQVIGKVFAADYTVPTPSNITTAVSDMETAFIDAAGRAPDFTELGAGDISSMILAPGVYKWGTGLLITSNVTLNGACGDVWIFEISKDLTINTGVKVLLSGGASPKNIFWQVSGQTKLNSKAHLEGNILTATAVVLDTAASVNGRLLAQTAVTLNQNTVVKP